MEELMAGKYTILRFHPLSMAHKYRLSFIPYLHIYTYIYGKAALFLRPIYTPSAPPPPWFYETPSVIGGREGSMGLRVIEREQGRRMWVSVCDLFSSDIKWRLIGYCVLVQ